MKPQKLNPSLSPFIGLSFLVLATTGVLLFFDIKNGPIKAMHEWMGWAFVIAGAIHMLVHLKQMLAYLRKPNGLISMGLALVIAIALVFVGLNHKHGSHDKQGKGTPPTMEG